MHWTLFEKFRRKCIKNISKNGHKILLTWKNQKKDYGDFNVEKTGWNYKKRD